MSRQRDTKVAENHHRADELADVWRTALDRMRPAVGQATFSGLLSRSRLLLVEGDRAVVGVPSEFAKRWLEQKHAALLCESLSEACGRLLEVELTVMDGGDRRPEPIVDLPSEARTEPAVKLPYDEFGATPLNPRYTFENFVVAECNRFAHAAAMQVAKAPGRAYNPLFIHSRVGLGKTHLMQAIGHMVKKRYPHAEVVYVSAETFVNHMISAIRDGTINAFRARYRRVDVWLVDDIQFIAALQGPTSEEEFFHTFNTLYETNKQIVIASDAPPRALRLLNDRLRSRLEMGIVADLRTPDLETRIAILEKKAEAEGIELPREILELIAKRIETNIRVLEGALMKVCAYVSLTGEIPTLSRVEELIADYSTAASEKRVTLEEILQAVCDRLAVEPEDVKGPKRGRQLVYARQIAIYLGRELTDNSLAAIGQFFGGRDHSTVLHSYTKVQKMIEGDRRTAALVSELKAALTQS